MDALNEALPTQYEQRAKIKFRWTITPKPIKPDRAKNMSDILKAASDIFHKRLFDRLDKNLLK